MKPIASRIHDRLAPVLILAIASTVLPSCGDEEAGRPKRYQAAGKVLVDGKGEKGIQVRLVPADRLRDGDALRPAGVSGDDGSYRLGTYEEADGAPAGTYKAVLFWPDDPNSQGRPKDQFGGKYSKPEASTIEVTIAEGENALPDIEVARATASARTRPAPRRRAAGPVANPDGPSAN
jgi:hypothetical protein